VVEHQYFYGPQSRPVPSYGVWLPTWAAVEAAPGIAAAAQWIKENPTRF
jgi:hypothetical protein